MALFREAVHAAFLVHLAPFAVEPRVLVVNPHVEIGGHPDAPRMTGFDHLAKQVHLETRIHLPDLRRVVSEPEVALREHGDVVDMGLAQRARELRRIELRADVVDARHGVRVQMDGPSRKFVHRAAPGARGGLRGVRRSPGRLPAGLSAEHHQRNANT